MSAMTPCPKDSPLMREWENYNQSDEYANSFKWAAYEEHRKGSMWAAFMAGFLAGNPSGAKGENNEGDLKRERDCLEEELEDVSKERDQLRYILCNFLGISIMERYDAIITQAKEKAK